MTNTTKKGQVKVLGIDIAKLRKCSHKARIYEALNYACNEGG
uniref:Uncharacterized protein n=1 Tax=Candidatus Kentrum sp. TUN TaxID=2126343 RepID=A0A451A472_9GAMM|nr:MAG: hypothetical protein BECKTUN1418F_GA0071002_12323 [Candidatus Kentron sp. TUN]VFK70095.1 MAG: hypothetical protein BECKTUN1418E_GA0071001_12353 [Candidatus Kentron sp. TUN]